MLTPGDELKFAAILDTNSMKERSSDKKTRDQLLLDIAKERRAVNGQATVGYVPGRITVAIYVSKLSSTRNRPQTKTERRLYAESDIRNFVTEIAVLEAIYKLGKIKDYNFCNTDVTTAVLSSDGAEFTAVYVAKDTDKNLRKLGRAVTRATPKKQKFVRMRMNETTTATGQMVSLVVSKRGVCKEGVSEPVKICLPGLNNTGDPITPGYLYLVPSSYTERQFMALIMKDIILPTLVDQRNRAQQAREALQEGMEDVIEESNEPESETEEVPYLVEEDSDEEDSDEEEQEEEEEGKKDKLATSSQLGRSSKRRRMMDLTAKDLGVEKEIQERVEAWYDRIVWSFDGDIPQIQALLEEEMAAYIEEHRVELFKFAAACSAKQQPNDVMKGFLVLKRLLRSLKFKYSELQEVEVPSYMANLKKFLKRNSTFDSEERELVESFFSKLPQVLRVSMSPKIIADGYRGLVPFDKVHLLTQCTSWNRYSEETQQQVIQSIPKLAKLAERYQLTEKMLDEANIPASPAPPDPEGFMDNQTNKKRAVQKKPPVPLEDLPLWRQRATWLNKEWVRERCREDARLQREEEARILAKAETKKAAAEKKVLLKEVKPWLVDLIKEVKKRDDIRLKSEKEAKREEERKAAPKQAVSKAMKQLFYQHCTNCSTLFKAGAKGWKGCAYCDYKWWRNMPQARIGEES